MSTISTPKTSNERREQDIAHILGLLQNKVQDLSEEIYVSRQLHDSTGVRTSLTSNIEKSIDNPVASLLELKTSIDESIHIYIDAIFTILFKRKESLIDEAYKSTESVNEILYLIVLYNDTHENRDEVFLALDHFEKIEVSHLYHVDFQFISKELSTKLTNAKSFPFK